MSINIMINFIKLLVELLKINWVYYNNFKLASLNFLSEILYSMKWSIYVLFEFDCYKFIGSFYNNL